MRAVPFVELATQAAELAPELLAAAERVLRSGSYVGGSEVDAFEQELARELGSPHAIACSSGSAGLHMALKALGIGSGDEVVTVSHTFAATGIAILQCGAKPIFVDIDAATATMSASQFESAITDKTRAVVPVHIYGRPADMQSIAAIARPRGIIIVEDAAQAHGAAVRGVPVGTLGDAACWSFYPTKNLGAIGEGGAVTTSSADLAVRLRILRNVGQRAKYEHVMLGFNYRMPELTAALLRVKLPHLRRWNQRRREIAKQYDQAFKSTASPVTVDSLPDGLEPVHHVYPVYHSRRDLARERLQEAGVQTGIHYPVPLHVQPAFQPFGPTHRPLPVTERIAATEISLPMFPELTDSQVDDVIAAVMSLPRPGGGRPLPDRLDGA